jgi:hypothetical protein
MHSTAGTAALCRHVAQADAALLLDAIDTDSVDFAAGPNADALVGKTAGLLRVKCWRRGRGYASVRGGNSPTASRYCWANRPP